MSCLKPTAYDLLLIANRLLLMAFRLFKFFLPIVQMRYILDESLESFLVETAGPMEVPTTILLWEI